MSEFFYRSLQVIAADIGVWLLVMPEYVHGHGAPSTVCQPD